MSNAKYDKRHPLLAIVAEREKIERAIDFQQLVVKECYDHLVSPLSTPAAKGGWFSGVLLFEGFRYGFKLCHLVRPLLRFFRKPRVR